MTSAPGICGHRVQGVHHQTPKPKEPAERDCRNQQTRVKWCWSLEHTEKGTPQLRTFLEISVKNRSDHGKPTPSWRTVPPCTGLLSQMSVARCGAACGDFDYRCVTRGVIVDVNLFCWMMHETAVRFCLFACCHIMWWDGMGWNEVCCSVMWYIRDVA